MPRISARRRHKLIPGLHHQLEARRLLTVAVQWFGQQDGADIVGTGPGVGPDGIKDIRLHLSNLQSVAESVQIQSIVIQGPSGFQWEYNAGAPSSAWGNAEFFFPSTNPGDWSQGDLYLNPKVASKLDGNGNPLGSSTGALLTLVNTNALSLTVTYVMSNGSTFTDTGSTTVNNLANPPLAMPALGGLNSVVTNSYPVSWSQFPNNGQDGTSYQGLVHLRVSGLAGKTIASATLSNQMGTNWYSTDTSGHEYLLVSSSGSDTAELYFPPVRDETVNIAGVSPSANMTLRLTFAGDSNQYVTRFGGGPWNPALVAEPLNTNSITVSTATALKNALAPASGATRYDTINLPANTTIIITEPLKVTHSFRLVGSNTTLKFQAAGWSPNIPGAIYLDDVSYNRELLFDISGVNIQFDTAYSHSWYDPSNEGRPHAVLNLRNINNSPAILKLQNSSISGPPALAPAPPTGPGSFHVYAGEPATPLVMTMANSGWTQSSGSIIDSTFTGGPLQLAGGPWTITGNQHYGARANTFGTAAFAFEGVHDLKFQNNTVSQVATGGTEFRLINIHGRSYNVDVSGNSFTGGQIGNEVTYYSAGSGSYAGINAPEIILTESYDVYYEGMVGTVSPDGWLISLPVPSASLGYRGTSPGGPGSVISIINTNNADGSANANAGRWFVVGQMISSSPPTFLMQSPMPAGSYTVSVAGGFVGSRYNNNTINIANKSSVGFSFPGNHFGTEIRQNNITGGGIYTYPYTGTAINVSAAPSNPNPHYQPGTSRPPAGYPYYMPLYWTQAPSFDVSIDSNIITNSAGGMTLGVPESSRQTAVGRVYLKASVTSNQFSWTSSWLSSWDTAFHAIQNGSLNLANASGDDSRPATINVGTGSTANGGGRIPGTVGGARGFIEPRQVNLTISGNTASISGPSGTTAVAEPSGQVYAGVINGAIAPSSPFPYDSSYHPPGNPALYAPFNARNLNVNPAPANASQVNLSASYNAVGITTPGSSVQGNFDQYQDSLSSAALGSTVTWNGQTFAMGPANANNIVMAGGQSLPIPQASYSALYLLAATAGYSQSLGGVFRLDYTDGTSDFYTIGISDWGAGYSGVGGTTAPGESIAKTMSSYNHFNGTTEVSSSATVYIYGTTIPVDPTRTLKFLSLPNDNKIKILAVNVAKLGPQVDLSGSYNAVGITTTGTGVQGNFDQYQQSLSAAALGSTVTWNGQTFAMGPANANNIVMAGGQSLPIPQASYSALYLLAATAGYSQSLGGVFRLDYTDGTSDFYTVGFSDWRTGYTGTAGTTAPGESIAKTMSSYNYFNGTTEVSASANVYVYGTTIPVDPNRTLKFLSLPNDNKIKILAVNVASPGPQVPMGSVVRPSGTSFPIPHNTIGISVDNNTSVGAGLDNAGNTYSANALGNTVTWAGQTFNMGVAGINNVQSFGGVSIDLPDGKFTNLLVLGAAIYGSHPGQLIVRYTDGTASTFNQTFSDWASGTTAAGESIAKTMTYFNTSSGQSTGNRYVYGYSFTLDSSKTVSYLQISNDNNIKVLAMDLINAPPQVPMGSVVRPGGSTFPIPYNTVGISVDNNTAVGGGFDNAGNTYSANALGNTIAWSGQAFNVGVAGINNVQSFGGVSIDLPNGRFTNLLVLGAAIYGSHPGQLIVRYTDGTASTFNQTFSDWASGTTAAGESIAKTMTYFNTSSGQSTGNRYVYGYSFTLDSSKTVSYLQISNDNNIKVLAMNLINSGGWQPPSGLLAAGGGSSQKAVAPSQAPDASLASLGAAANAAPLANAATSASLLPGSGAPTFSAPIFGDHPALLLNDPRGPLAASQPRSSGSARATKILERISAASRETSVVRELRAHSLRLVASPRATDAAAWRRRR